MKKVMALALAIASASSANAALNLGNTTSGNAAGELFITMWNADTQQSFVQDLNIYTSDLFYKTGAFGGHAITIDQAAIDALGAGNISWTIAGANMDKTTDQFDRDNFPTGLWRNNRGVAFTASPEPTTAANPVVTAAISSNWINLTTKLNSADNSANADVYQLSGSGYFGDALWGLGLGSMASNFNYTSSAGTNNGSMAMYGLQWMDDHSEAPAGGDDTYHVVNYGDWTLAGNQLVFTPVSEVPVPAAAWLFGSALLGLAGVGRNRKISAK